MCTAPIFLWADRSGPSDILSGKRRPAQRRPGKRENAFLQGAGEILPENPEILEKPEILDSLEKPEILERSE